MIIHLFFVFLHQILKKLLVMNRFFLFLLSYWALLSGLQAQELTVKSMTTSQMDISASQYERKDFAGLPCALVKVLLVVPGAEFEGNVIPPVEFKTSEYWVYLPDGTNELRVKCPGYTLKHVPFENYGIKEVKSKSVYNLTIVTSATNGIPHEQQLTIRYTPTDAVVLVDSKLRYGQQGVATAMLPVGQHNVIVTANGYVPYEGYLELNANTPSSVTVNLEKDATPNTAMSSAIAIETFSVGGTSFNMVRVDGGTFAMGATEEQGISADDAEKPAHQVTLSSYMIGETEVTQALWQAVMGSDPSYYGGSNRPVEQVSWEDCQVFIQKLNQVTGRQFRLPTEAEWEFAARGGNNSRKKKYSGGNAVGQLAWHTGNSSNTNNVKTKAPNELGLYDMSGNVWEWCQDWYGEYTTEALTNPKGSLQGTKRVYRGGGYLDSAVYCRVSCRSSGEPSFRLGTIGMRLAM